MIPKEYISLKYSRLKQKPMKEFFVTIAKRFPRYFKKLRLMSLIQKDTLYWKKLIPYELSNNKTYKISNSSLFLKKLDDTKEFKEIFNQDSIISRSDDITKNNMRIFGKRVKYNGKFPNWHHSIDISSNWPLLEENKINYHDYINYGDPRYVWELNRFLHFSDLSRAYWITKNNTYAERMCLEIGNWIKTNPFMHGINWKEGIEVSLRSINWIFAYHFFSKSSSFEKIEDKFFESLYLHGYYLNENLSDKWSLNNNHIIAELTGLIFLGHFFRDFEFGKKWLNKAIDSLAVELDNQVMNDGFIWESSTGYHKFVTELVYLSERLITINNHKSNIRSVLMKMIDAVFYTIKPNDKVCKIGDSDDAVVFKLSNQSSEYPDFLKSASISYNNSKYFFDEKHSEYSFWINGISRKEINQSTNDKIKLFRDAGLFFYEKQTSTDRIWLCFNIGNQSVKHHGSGHRHADLLSILINVNGDDIVSEGGTYKYFGKKSVRNFFKSTYIHSTTNLSNKSQIEFQERFETSLENNAKSDILMYNTDNHEIKGSHDGYCSKNLTLFERTISFGNQITINDCRLSDNYNNLPMNTNFIIPENVEIKKIDDRTILLNNRIFMKVKSTDVNIERIKSFQSKNYGLLERCNILQVTSPGKEIITAFSVESMVNS